MSVIGIDGSILLHGERAGKRHSRNLLEQLVRRFARDEWRLLYFDRKGNTPGRIPLAPNAVARETVSRIPMRLLSGAWRRLGCPPVENWIGSIDVFYAPDLHFPPPGTHRCSAPSGGLPISPSPTCASPEKSVP
ncbi:MAG: hypothetical protein MZV70_32955 [Desulfobacterales bacterium]|nr:hypothetical protein [Desulfobacterales bacterium]